MPRRPLPVLMSFFVMFCAGEVQLSGEQCSRCSQVAKVQMHGTNVSGNTNLTILVHASGMKSSW
eukprot:9476138-Pyramimonas_sp.AAC.1